VIFGSYAASEQKKGSDLDVAVFIESEDRRKRMEAAVNSARLKSPLELDAHVITKPEMVEMLTNDEENLGKQIARKHLAVYNHGIFYEIIKEGMKHGFRA
jgi:predicted nucleotidyltransferase